MFEPPAGLLDATGELPLETARRELAEEAGVRASQWNVLVDLFNSPGGSSEAIRVFLARGLESLPGGRPHTGEAEEAHLPQAWVPLAEAVDLVLHGQVGSPSAVAGILALAALPTRNEGDLRPANDPWNARAWLEANSRVRRV